MLLLARFAAAWGISALKLILPDNFPRTADIHIDGSALLFTTLASVATGLIFGLAPAFRASRTDVTKSLNEGDRGTEGFGRNRLRSVLVISQVAHEAYISVDEDGTEAAAATGVVAVATSGHVVTAHPIVTVDHPFLFAITDTKTGTPLFLGRVTDPTAG